ncbi:MAG TPA: hypothetical protein PLR22_02810 [Saprospiraceae bacterium]|nr:hypothetical protein [Saprospiraceae bacterium]
MNYRQIYSRYDLFCVHKSYDKFLVQSYNFSYTLNHWAGLTTSQTITSNRTTMTRGLGECP